jgi:hypothetical protein
MEASSAVRTSRLRGSGPHDGARRPISRNKQWVAGDNNRSRSSTPHHGEDGRWERGGHRGGRGGRGRGSGHTSPRKGSPFSSTNGHSGITEDIALPTEEPYLETQEEREKFYQEVSLQQIYPRVTVHAVRLAREGARSGKEESYRRGKDGRSFGSKTVGRRYYDGWNMPGYVSSF